MSDREIADFLAIVPLLAGRDDDDLMSLARVVRRRTLRAGETLWRLGDEARELVFVVDGVLSASLHLPGDRTVEIWRGGRGDAVGEIALIDGRGHTMGVRVLETATLLSLGRVEFAALLARQDSSAIGLRRHLATLFTSRHRAQLGDLAASLGGEPAGPQAGDAVRTFAELEPSGPPDSRYVRRLATFHDLDALALWSFLTSGTYATCPPGRALLVEGAPSTACYLTMNGAVEKVLLRGDRRIRVGLAGPGRTIGYESFIDGGPSPVTAITRERALLLVLPRGPFEQLFRGDDAVSRVFLDVIQRELVAALRQSLRQHARLAASV
ncbi:MAG: cyclic nucleotide-binding domain-containing protein [Gaiellales bacterium]